MATPYERNKAEKMIPNTDTDEIASVDAELPVDCAPAVPVREDEPVGLDVPPVLVAVEVGTAGAPATPTRSGHKSALLYSTQLDEAGTRAVYGMLLIAPSDSAGWVYVWTTPF